MRIGGPALLIAALALAAPLVTAPPAAADFKIGFSTRPAPPARSGFKPLFGRRGHVVPHAVVIERVIEVPVEVEPPSAAARANRPDRPRLHQAASLEAEEEAAVTPVTVLRPIGQRIATPQ